jgi:CIC family chloride channel protein
MTRDLTVCYPNESLKTALHKMAVRNIGRIPVVNRDDQEHIVGLITRKSIITAYNQALEAAKSKSAILSQDK